MKPMKEWAKEIHAWAISKGFWEEGIERNKGEICALIHSEISELRDGILYPGPSDHVPELTLEEEELADIVIRVLDCAGAWGGDMNTAVIIRRNEDLNDPMADEAPRCIICNLHSEVSKLLEAIRKPTKGLAFGPGLSPIEQAMAGILNQVIDRCRDQSIDLDRAMELKMEFNHTRPHKHGKKF